MIATEYPARDPHQDQDQDLHGREPRPGGDHDRTHAATPGAEDSPNHLLRPELFHRPVRPEPVQAAPHGRTAAADPLDPADGIDHHRGEDPFERVEGTAAGRRAQQS